MKSKKKTVSHPEDEFMTTAAKTVHHEVLHPKEIRWKHRIAEKRVLLPTIEEVNRIPYIDESMKLVDKLPRVEREQQAELKRLLYSPANCNCCWSANNHWYRRHHSVLKKKGDNKDNKSGHWMRRALMRPPSYVSKYSIRQDIAEGLSDYYFD